MKHFLLIIITIFLPFFVNSQSNQHKEVALLEIGAHLPWFSLKGVDDKVYTPDNFKDGELLFVIFTCDHCPTAQAYENRIIDLFEEYNDDGVDFVAISPNNNDALSLAECGYTDLDDSFESMKIRAKDIELKFPYLYDGDIEEVSMKFGPVATPHVFIFDRERKLRYRGRIDDMENPYEHPNTNDARNAIQALLNEKPVPVETTKTFGCSVKWAWKDEWTKQLVKNWGEEEVKLMHADKQVLKDVISNKQGNLRLINIWATYCGPCVMEFPDLVDTYRMYNGRGFDFVTVSMDQYKSEEAVLKFLKENQASEFNYIWSGGSSYDAIEIIDPDWQGSLPYTLLIKPGGQVIYSHEGPVDNLQLRKAIINELGRYFADDK